MVWTLPHEPEIEFPGGGSDRAFAFVKQGDQLIDTVKFELRNVRSRIRVVCLKEPHAPVTSAKRELRRRLSPRLTHVDESPRVVGLSVQVSENQGLH